MLDRAREGCRPAGWRKWRRELPASSLGILTSMSPGGVDTNRSRPPLRWPVRVFGAFVAGGADRGGQLLLDQSLQRVTRDLAQQVLERLTAHLGEQLRQKWCIMCWAMVWPSSRAPWKELAEGRTVAHLIGSPCPTSTTRWGSYCGRFNLKPRAPGRTDGPLAGLLPASRSARPCATPA
jgi:hypothetical protein